MDILQFIGVIVTMVILAVILGYRNRATRPLYWAILAVQVPVLAISWLFLAIMTEPGVRTFLQSSRDMQTMVIHAVRLGLCVGFCILLVATEMYRGRRMMNAKEAP